MGRRTVGLFVVLTALAAAGSASRTGIIHPSRAAFIQSTTAEAGEIFGPSATIAMRLEAPLESLFESGRLDPDTSVPGSLTLQTPDGDIRVRGVSVSVRGHTSLLPSECTFPKLTLTLPSTRPPILRTVETLKIGTHCADRPDAALTPKYGRWANEKAPLREAAVYRLLAALDVPTLRARAARITYVFTDTGKSVTRNALLLEDDDAAMKRLGATTSIDETQFTSARQAFSAHDALRTLFAEAMIGNFDWCLRFFATDTYRCDQRHPVWNMLALKTPRGTIPVVYDFDLSGMVTGRHLWFDGAFGTIFPGWSTESEAEVLSQVQRARTLFERNDLDALRRSFLEKKEAAYASLRESPLDEGWLPRMDAYLDAFFRAIDSDTEFYRPMLASPASMFADASATRPVCDANRAPAGTLVSQPLDSRRSMRKVIVLDILWHWAQQDTCSAIRTAPVWLPASSITREIPRVLTRGRAPRAGPRSATERR